MGETTSQSPYLFGDQQRMLATLIEATGGRMITKLKAENMVDDKFTKAYLDGMKAGVTTMTSVIAVLVQQATITDTTDSLFRELMAASRDAMTLLHKQEAV